MASSINLQHHYNDTNCSCIPCNVGGDGDQSHRPAHHRDENSSTATNNIDGRRDEMMQQSEDFLASELSKLSVQERTEAFEDVHCVGEELKETPEMIQKALVDFAVAVVVLMMNEGNEYQVYDTAVQQNRAYVEDDSFRLKFLRANFYDAEKSVRQMMRFLQMKATYFGIDKVARDITLDDLNEEDMEALQSGMCHIQEGRDRSGRVIVHYFGNLKWNVENAIRATYIMWVNIVGSELVVQTKGAVNIIHNIARTGQEIAMPGIDFMMTVDDAYTSFPIRCSSTHFCLHEASTGDGNSVFSSFLRAGLKLMPVYETVRSRIHVGHSIEIKYQLQTHGIPLESFPVDMNGKVREDILDAWLVKYQQQEGGNLPASKPFAMAPSPVTPSENDVLLGRGKLSQYWSGTVKFREFIEKHSDDYNRLPRKKRQGRTTEVTEALLAKGIRFLSQDEASGEWVEADRAEVRKKVSQMFRSIRKWKPNVG